MGIQKVKSFSDVVKRVQDYRWLLRYPPEMANYLLKNWQRSEGLDFKKSLSHSPPQFQKFFYTCFL